MPGDYPLGSANNPVFVFSAKEMAKKLEKTDPKLPCGIPGHEKFVVQVSINQANCYGCSRHYVIPSKRMKAPGFALMKRPEVKFKHMQEPPPPSLDVPDIDDDFDPDEDH